MIKTLLLGTTLAGGLLVAADNLNNTDDRITPVPTPQPRRIMGGRWDITAAQVKAIDRGLEWLAKEQKLPRGCWNNDVGYKVQAGYAYWKKGVPHVGVTSLALMAFLANGSLPGRGRYGRNVEAGLEFVLNCVRPDGSIEAQGTRMYSHAFATLFLAEVYGTTQNGRVRRKLQQAIRFIVDAQNREGGWRYRPKADRSDMSVTVCQVMALRAARNVGIHVPFSVIKRAVNYVRRSEVTPADIRRTTRRYPGHGLESGAFKYQIDRPGEYYPHRSSFPLTAAGVTTLLGAGYYEDRLVENGLDYMRRNLRASLREPEHYFFSYGHYYAAQAHFTCGSKERWRHYFTAVRKTLLAAQQFDGRWKNTTGPGDSFATAMATLILQVPYEYLPIFQR